MFTSSGSADAHGNATEVGQGIDSASFGVGPRMHMTAAYAYRISFHRISDFRMKIRAIDFTSLRPAASLSRGRTQASHLNCPISNLERKALKVALPSTVVQAPRRSKPCRWRTEWSSSASAQYHCGLVA